MRRIGVLAGLALLAAAPAAARAADADYAPLDRPGPALTAKASLSCSPGIDGATRAPVLLNPATGVTAEQNYSWNWERALTMRGIPWCAYDAPQHTLGDIQTSGELLVDAIRTMHARAGRPIAILGHSQGAMSMRWALRFWPDTRPMIDDVIGFAGTNHGTTALPPCDAGCPAASWQQGATAHFIAALNSRAETFAAISYTNVYTRTDETATPTIGPTPTSALHTGAGAITNVATQDVCPASLYEHLLIGTVDPAAYALGIDALDHSGPADPARVPRSVCAQLYQPGVDPLNAEQYIQILAALPGLGSVVSPASFVEGVPTLKAEPPVRCYALAAGCGGAAPAPVACTSHRRFVIRLPRGIRAARVTLNGHRVKVRRSGPPTRSVATIDLRGRAGGKVTVRVRGRSRGGHAVRQVRHFRVCTPGLRQLGAPSPSA